VFLGCISVLLAVAVAPAAGSEGEPQVDVIWGVTIPVRDGVRLHATLYRPVEMPDRLPVVVALTPYTADTYHERGWYFARHG